MTWTTKSGVGGCDRIWGLHSFGWVQGIMEFISRWAWRRVADVSCLLQCLNTR
jgi:hypothetical protein